MEIKERAGRNRTLTVEEKEIPALKKLISCKKQIQGFDSFDNKLIHADLFSVLDFIPEEIADLIIIDPPYNLSKNFNGMPFHSQSSEDYENYLRQWLHKVCTKLKKTGSLYLCGDWKCTASMQKILSEELTIINRITWQREKGRGAKNNWKNGMEDIWFAVRDAKNYFFNVEAVMMKRKVRAPYKQNGLPKDWELSDSGNFRTTYPSNFWDDISIPFWSMPENTDHPTQKPEKLIAKLILASSKPDDLVFDPFSGSGTTCVVAKKLERKFLAVECNEEYCLWTAKRLLSADNDKDIQGYSDGVFWERNSLLEQKKHQQGQNKTLPD